VLDPGDPDTRSAGSFFTNPILDPARAAELEHIAPGFPRWTADSRAVKVPAAWLIEHAGFPKGYAGKDVAISSKHTLALTNRGSASTQDLLALAREVRDGVRDRFGVELHPEPLLINCSL
jgi:UDP-N-acetylmuramate dehydrogenase